MLAQVRHLGVRPDWLAQVTEEALEPALPIIDPHHHLWERPGAVYHRRGPAGGYQQRPRHPRDRLRAVQRDVPRRRPGTLPLPRRDRLRERRRGPMRQRHPRARSAPARPSWARRSSRWATMSRPCWRRSCDRQLPLPRHPQQHGLASRSGRADQPDQAAAARAAGREVPRGRGAAAGIRADAGSLGLSHAARRGARPREGPPGQRLHPRPCRRPHRHGPLRRASATKSSPSGARASGSLRSSPTST
jgi:hypothetical protein